MVTSDNDEAGMAVQFVASLSQKGYSGANHAWFSADELAERMRGQAAASGWQDRDWLDWSKTYLEQQRSDDADAYGKLAYDPNDDKYRLRG